VKLELLSRAIPFSIVVPQAVGGHLALSRRLIEDFSRRIAGEAFRFLA
jgi:hypothetical protein